LGTSAESAAEQAARRFLAGQPAAAVIRDLLAELGQLRSWNATVQRHYEQGARGNDALQGELHGLQARLSDLQARAGVLRSKGWGLSEQQVLGAGGLRWVVSGSRGAGRLRAVAPTQAEAWADAFNQVEVLEAENGLDEADGPG
jgi:hypothetical protein